MPRFSAPSGAGPSPGSQSCSWSCSWRCRVGGPSEGLRGLPPDPRRACLCRRRDFRPALLHPGGASPPGGGSSGLGRRGRADHFPGDGGAGPDGASVVLPGRPDRPRPGNDVGHLRGHHPGPAGPPGPQLPRAAGPADAGGNGARRHPRHRDRVPQRRSQQGPCRPRRRELCRRDHPGRPCRPAGRRTGRRTVGMAGRGPGRLRSGHRSSCAVPRSGAAGPGLHRRGRGRLPRRLVHAGRPCPQSPAAGPVRPGIPAHGRFRGRLQLSRIPAVRGTVQPAGHRDQPDLPGLSLRNRLGALGSGADVAVRPAHRPDRRHGADGGRPGPDAHGTAGPDPGWDCCCSRAASSRHTASVPAGPG